MSYRGFVGAVISFGFREEVVLGYRNNSEVVKKMPIMVL
jgi:hypothetical protein